MASTEDFDRAVLIAFQSASGGVDESLKRRAEQYCSEVRQWAPVDCIQLCAQRVEGSPYAEVRFWCLQTLHEVLGRAYVAQLSDAQQSAVQQMLLRWVLHGTGRREEGFLRAKLAQVVVLVLQLDYPRGRWPGFFGEVIAGALKSDDVADMFCRILLAIDEDVVSLELPRSSSEQKASMALKDAMRDGALGEVAAAWCELLAAHRGREGGVAEALLRIVARCVVWVDVGLVANERFVGLLYSCAGGPPRLAAAACHCLAALVAKGMDAGAKLDLVEQLGVVPLAAGLAEGAGALDPELQSARLHLLATLAQEVLDAWKKVENSLVSMAAVGLALDEAAAGEARAVAQRGAGYVRALLPAALHSLRLGEEGEGANLTLVPFLAAYLAKLKLAQKRGEAAAPEDAAFLPQLFAAVADCLELPAGGGAGGAGAPLPAPGGPLWDEAQEGALDARRELFVLFRAGVRVAREEAYREATRRLEGAVFGAGGGAPWPRAEAAVALLYELGEGAREADVAPSGPLGHAALRLMRTDIPAGSHPALTLAFLEVYVRYGSKLLAQEPACIPHCVLDVFLGAHGVGSANQAVATRACYLFSRIVKALRPSLVSLLPQILSALQPHLAAILTQPAALLPSAPASRPGLGGPTGSGVSGAGSGDDRLYAFEAVGLLLGSEELPAAQQAAALAALLEPLLAQAQRSTALLGVEGSSQRAAVLVQQALDAASRVSKGFRPALCAHARPALADLWLSAVGAGVQVLRVTGPGDAALRGRAISLLHRMVETLGERLVPSLPPVLDALLGTAAPQAPALTEATALLSQLALRYRAELRPLLSKVFPVICKSVHAVLNADSDWTGAAGDAARPSESGRERGELARTYLGLLLALASNQLAEVLLGDTGVRSVVLPVLLRSAEGHVDVACRRVAVQALRHCVTAAAAQPGAPELARSLAGGAVRVAVVRLARSGDDVRDSGVVSLLGDLAALLTAARGADPDALAAALQGPEVVALQLSPQVQAAVMQGLKDGDAKALRGALKLLLQQSAAAPPGSRPRAALGQQQPQLGAAQKSTDSGMST